MRAAARGLAIALAVVGALMLAVPASVKTKSPSPKTSDDLARVMTALGLGCEDFVSSGPSAPTHGFPKAHQGECTIAAGTASLAVMANAADRAKAIDSMPIDCSS